MTPENLRAVLAAVPITEARLARLLNLHVTTPCRWATGVSPIPTSAALLLRMLEGGRITLEDLEAIRGLWEPS